MFLKKSPNISFQSIYLSCCYINLSCQGVSELIIGSYTIRNNVGLSFTAGFSGLFLLNLSPASPALPSRWWTSWAPVRARRCILPTGKSRQAVRSARSRSRRGHSGRGRRTSRASGCSPPSSCSGNRASCPLYARPPTETTRVPRCSGRSSACLSFGFGREKENRTVGAFTAGPWSPRRGLRVNFPTERRAAAQRRRGARKSCPADGSVAAEELIVKMSESHTSTTINPCCSLL